MNGPVALAVVLTAVALVVVGAVVTILVLSNAPASRWRNPEGFDEREVTP